MWSCPKCRAKVDHSFEICWSCGTSRDGEEDPAFTRADDDDGSIDAPPWKWEHKVANDPDFEVAECYWASNTLEAMFVANQLVTEGIPATADDLELRIVFAGLFGLVPAGPYFGPRVRVLAEDLPAPAPGSSATKDDVEPGGRESQRTALQLPSLSPHSSLENRLRGSTVIFAYQCDGWKLEARVTNEKERAMSRYEPDDDRDGAGTATEIIPSHGGRGTSWETPPDDGTPPRLQVQVVERTAIVHFVDSEILFEDAAVRAVSQQLHRLLWETGHTRLVVNFAGVHHVSSDILAVLAALQREVELRRGRITLCGLDPLLQDMVRITHLGRVFDIVSNEVEALGLIAR